MDQTFVMRMGWRKPGSQVSRHGEPKEKELAKAKGKTRFFRNYLIPGIRKRRIVSKEKKKKKKLPSRKLIPLMPYMKQSLAEKRWRRLIERYTGNIFKETDSRPLPAEPCQTEGQYLRPLMHLQELEGEVLRQMQKAPLQQ